MRIFVSYRRSDAQTVTGNLWQQLCGEFGEDNIFFDHASLPAGLDYQAWIADEIARSTAVLVVIGPRWTTITQDGIQRLSIPEDDVRREVELALAQVDVVVPVLVAGAAMPRPDELPESIRPLVKRTAVTVRDYPDFVPDSQRLADRLRQAVAAAGLPAASAQPAADPAERCRELGEAGRIEECLETARQLLDPATPGTVDQIEEAVKWLCYARRWAEAGLRLQPLTAAATAPSVQLRLELLQAQCDGATGELNQVADLERIVAGARAAFGGGSPVTARARGQLAEALAWSDAEERAAALVRELADDVPHSFRDDPFGAVWERLWLAFGVVANTHSALREALADLAATTLADATATLGAEHPATLHCRVLDGWLSGRDPGAPEALRSVARQFGRSHPGYAWVLGVEVRRLQEAGDLAGAADARTRLLTWVEEAFGPDHPDALGLLESLAGLQSEAGLSEAAVQTAETLLTRRRLGAGRQSEPALNAAVVLAKALSAAGRPTKAFSTLARALEESTVPAKDRVQPELELVGFAWAKADYADCLARAERLLAEFKPKWLSDTVLPWLHQMAVYSLEELDRPEEALSHSEHLLPAPGEEFEAATARDILHHGRLLRRLHRYPEAAELLTAHWDGVAAALAEDPPLRLEALAAREVSVTLADDEPTALHEVFNELAALSPEELETVRSTSSGLLWQALILLADARELIGGLADAGLGALTDWAVHESGDPELVLWAIDLVGQHPRGLGHLRQLLENADLVAGGVAEAPRLALAYAKAHRSCQAAGATLEPLRRAPDPYTALSLAHGWLQEHPEAVGSDAADELDRAYCYAAMDGHPPPRIGRAPFLRLIERLRSDYGAAGPSQPSISRPWEFSLPQGSAGRSQAAAACLGLGLFLLRPIGEDDEVRARAGARLIAATVMRLDASSGGRHLLGDAGWTDCLPQELPFSVGRRLTVIDRGFEELAKRGAAGWIGEDVPDLFEHAPVRDAPWQQVTQALVNRWAEPKFAALPDPYGRYKDGSWPIPPPDGQLPDVYQEFADLLVRAAADGFLFEGRR